MAPYKKATNFRTAFKVRVKMMNKNENLNKYRKNMSILSIYILLFCVLMLHAFINFNNSYLRSELKNKQKELEKTAQIKTESVHKKYGDMLVSLAALANNAENLTEENADVIISELKFLSKVGYFSCVGISDAQGNTIDSQGQTGYIQEREYFKSAMNGNVTISDVLTSTVIPDDEIQVIAFPIYRNEAPNGIVYGILNVDELDHILENETGNHIYTQIVDSQGNYVTRGKTSDILMKNKSIWEDFARYTFIESDITTIKTDVEKRKSGDFTFHLDGEEHISYYMPLDIGNYYIFSTTSSTHIKSRMSEIRGSVIALIIEVSAATFILLFGIYKNNKFMHENLKKSHKEVLSSVEMIAIAVQESNQYIFEYDINTGSLCKKAGVENALFVNSNLDHVPNSIAEAGMVAESSVADFKEMFAKIKNEPSTEGIIKTETEGVVRWFKVKMKNIYDEKGKTINTVGIVEDITEKKTQEELLKMGNKERRKLKERAERDGLTGLYNADTLKTKVSDILEDLDDNASPHLFALLDLDNFKEINDNFGHQYGDSVLVEVAQILKNTFRKDDIVARLGGDEFAILLVNAANYEVMEPIFQNLCNNLSRTYMKDGKAVKVSASLGIASAPQQGTTFEELYKKSDLALYQVKNESKNGFKIFKEPMETANEKPNYVL